MTAELEIPRYLKTTLQGGIGDCIKHLTCNFALPSLNKEYGTKVFVSYEGFGVNSHYQEEPIDAEKLEELQDIQSPWEKILKDNVFDPCEFIIPLKAEAFVRLDCLTVNMFFDTHGPQLHNVLTPLMPLELNIHSPFIASKKHRNIALQLSSNEPAKQWNFSRWKGLVDAILEKYDHTTIYLLDSPKQKETIEAYFMDGDPRVINAAGSSLAESISLIAQMDLLISPDSFSKYIALCNRVPAIILCADVEFMTSSDLLRGCFLADIVYNDNYKLLGVEVEDDFNVKHIVKNVNDISVEEVAKYV